MSIDAISYRVWNASTGKWARSANKVDDVMFVTEETDDPRLAATWSWGIAERIVRDGLHQGKRLHEVAVDREAPSPGFLRAVRHEGESPVPLTPVQKAAWDRLEAKAGQALVGVAALENRRDEFLRRLDAIDMRLRQDQERLNAHEGCLDGHRKSLCAVIERLEAVDKARTLERLVGAYPGRKAEKLVSVPDPRLKSPRQMCREYSIQACHYCERLACGDNTSPGAALYRAAKKVLDDPAGVEYVTRSGLATAVMNLEAMG